MKYVEICKGLRDRGNIQEIALLTPENRDYEFYISMFPFDNSILDYLKVNKTISGHKGKHFCDYILIDVDCENDLEKSKTDAIQIIKRLNQLYEINPDELFIWFSGNKGFHIAMISKSYGVIEPSEETPEIVKGFIKHLAQGIDENIDYAIYEPHRIMRVENSLNKKSMLYKIQLLHDELINLSMLEIRRLAKEPRVFKRKIKKSDIIYREKIRRDLKSPKKEIVKKEITQDGFFTPGNEGNRNNQIYKQSAMLFSQSDLNESSILEIIFSINQGSGSPLNHNEVSQIVRSASKNKRQQKEQDIELFTFNELIPAYLDSLLAEKERISLLFESINRDFEGKLRGKLGVILGYGGSKKSLYGQNVTLDNIFNYSNNVIYSNMEMPESELIERFINIASNDPGGYLLPSQEIKRLYTGGKEREIIHKMLVDEIGVIFRNKLKICSTPSMTSDRFNEIIISLNEKTDVLIVDGLSMMGGSGSELELANKHSKELKELAKTHNIFVMAIVHASKGEDYETRDLTRKARASEKIIDNCDFAMTMSMIKEDGNFNERKGVYNCWNKRGTGKRIQKGFEFEKNTLRARESDFVIDDNVKY